jgi:hypothetical protein
MMCKHNFFASMFNNTISIRQCTAIAGTVLFGFLSSGCSMADTVTASPPTGDHVKVVDVNEASAEIKALDEEVTKFLRGKFAIKSGQYYRFSADMPWVAISKNVQNQMTAKSVTRKIYDWNNPGYDFVDVYPQGEAGFAMAMFSKSGRGEAKLVGYYLLTAGK